MSKQWKTDKRIMIEVGISLDGNSRYIRAKTAWNLHHSCVITVVFETMPVSISQSGDHILHHISH